MRSQVFHLRGFAHAVQTFKSDKFAALWKRHDRDLIINPETAKPLCGKIGRTIAMKEPLCDLATTLTTIVRVANAPPTILLFP
jgi:hypothetical protein